MGLTIGQVILNRYRVAALLGQGGMGDVYRAWDLNLKIPVALKENLDTSPEAQQQFGEEARLLARLSHPNLPRVTDYFTMPGQGEYLVMDYIEGVDLEQELENADHSLIPTQGLRPQTALPWIIQTCDALIYLHDQRPPVIHRDIKPANIKITPDGRAVLVDFGIAKRYDPQRATSAGARAVTPGYSPPEQYGGASTDARSDIYALGATLYHLLTGQQPPESVQRVAGTAPNLAPRSLNPEITPAVEHVILKAMAVEMERRYQTAAEMRADLQTAGGWVMPVIVQPAVTNNSPVSRPKPAPVPVEPLRRRPTTAPPPPEGFVASNWPLLLLGGAALLVLLLVVARTAVAQYRQNQARQAAAAQATAFAALVSPTAPLPTSTSPIDDLLVKSNATQTAEAHQATRSLPPTSVATPHVPDYRRVLYENFKDNQNDWLTGIQGSLACWIAAQRYTCQVQSGQAANHFQWLERYAMPSEFVLSADVYPGPDRPHGLGDANAGLVFRSTDQGRYLFSIRNDGAFRVSSIQSAPANWVDEIPWTYSDAIRRGEANRLTIVGRGQHYDLYIDGQYLGGFDDNLWVDGHPGIHLFTAPGEKPALVEFSDLELRTP